MTTPCDLAVRYGWILHPDRSNRASGLPGEGSSNTSCSRTGSPAEPLSGRMRSHGQTGVSMLASANGRTGPLPARRR